MQEIPLILHEILLEQYEEELVQKIENGYKARRPVTLRVNTIKSNLAKIKQKLEENKIIFRDVEWNNNALIIENVREEEIKKLDIYENGEIYLQSLSSMLPPIILEPAEGENILDMAAAPGGKTTQIAAITNNGAMITACEKNKIRAERLKYNLEKQGVKCANIMTEDSRKLDNFFSFDKILLDAPCSGSGTENIFNDKFTKELIDRSIKTQEELLRKAIKILKPGGEMIYSTCSIIAKENEKNLEKILKYVEIIPIEVNNSIPLLPVTIPGTICICPNDLYEGFFVAKIKRRKV